ncbi:MAG: ABC transporter ATP-binding protein [Gemmatimonadota bacterium]
MPQERVVPGQDAPRNDEAVLAARGLKRRYGGRTVVDVDDFAVAPGEIVAVLGPNGAGKSTLLRLLMLLERPDAGHVLFRGRTVAPSDRAVRRQLAGVFQKPFLFTGTVAENVEFGLAARGVPRPERRRRVAAALDWLDLARHAGAPVGILSGGAVQRVGLARALVLEPAVLFLDEPTANLDVTIRRRFRQDLERLLRARAGAAVLVTHDAADAFALADRIAVLEEGRIVQTGTPADIVHGAATPFVAAFTGAELMLRGIVAGHDGALVLVRAPGGATIVASTPAGEPLPVNTAAHVAYRPEDVTLAPADTELTTSARNRFRVRVVATSPVGGLVRVRLDGEVELSALLTRQSAQELGITTGRNVCAFVKTTALRVFPAGPPT